MWKEGQNVWVLDVLSFMLFKLYIFLCMGFPCSSYGKESAYNAGDLGLILGLGRSPGGRHGNPLQYTGLENPMVRGAWWATVHGVQRVGHDWVTDHSWEASLAASQQGNTGLSPITTRSWILPISWMSLDVISALRYPKQRIWSYCAQISDL